MITTRGSRVHHLRGQPGQRLPSATLRAPAAWATAHPVRGCAPARSLQRSGDHRGCARPFARCICSRHRTGWCSPGSVALLAGQGAAIHVAAAGRVSDRPHAGCAVLSSGAIDPIICTGDPYPVPMTIRPIVICGEPVLHRPTRPVTEFGTAELDALIQDLFETNEAAFGAGLAANQIGDERRVFVYDCPDHGTRRRGYVVNPVIETSVIPTNMPDPDDDSEGCLSVPGESFPTGRAGLGQGHRIHQRRQADRGRGHRLLRSMPAARGGPSGRVPVPGPIDRPQRPQRAEGCEGQRLGCARTDLASG